MAEILIGTVDDDMMAKQFADILEYFQDPGEQLFKAIATRYVIFLNMGHLFRLFLYFNLYSKLMWNFIKKLLVWLIQIVLRQMDSWV